MLFRSHIWLGSAHAFCQLPVPFPNKLRGRIQCNWHNGTTRPCTRSRNVCSLGSILVSQRSESVSLCFRSIMNYLLRYLNHHYWHHSAKAHYRGFGVCRGNFQRRSAPSNEQRGGINTFKTSLPVLTSCMKEDEMHPWGDNIKVRQSENNLHNAEV